MYRANSSISSLVDRRLAAALTVLLLAGCGFQLRGVGTVADLEPLYVTATRETATFDVLVRNLARAGVTVLGQPAAGAWRLILLEDRTDERVATVTERGLAAEIELTVQLRYQLEDDSGRLLIAPQQVSVARVFRQDPDRLAGSSRERDLLLAEMHRELAQQIVRILNATSQSTEHLSHAGPTR
jgi:LPS-assembly lipoprotein